MLKLPVILPALLKAWFIGLCVLRGGVNILTNANSNDRSWGPNSDYNPQAGGEIEYTFNPLWGLGLDYMWVRNNQSTL